MKRLRLFMVAGLFSCLHLVLSPKAFGETNAPNYQVIDLGTLENRDSGASGINASGQVIVNCWKVNVGTRAFLWSKGSIQELGSLGGGSSSAAGVNSSGQVVGSSWTSDQYTRAFLWSKGSMQDLGTIGGSQSYARGINDIGQVVGNAITSNGLQQPFVYSGGFMRNIGTLGGQSGSAESINELGQVVGYSGTSASDDSHAFLYSNGVMHDLSVWENTRSAAFSINDIGQIIGYYYNMSDWFLHAFTYSNGVTRQFGGDGVTPWGINNKGQIVGGFAFASLTSHAFLWQDNTVYDLNDLVETNISPNWVLSEANDINDSGQIVGVGINPLGRRRAFLLNPIPGGWKQAITNQPTYPTYGTLPERGEGKDSLIVVTHGYIPPWQTAEESATWVDSMSNSISQYLSAHGLGNWQVAGYKWPEGAKVATPPKALSNGKDDGYNIGKRIVDDEWSHVHFIAHSAGCGLINAASEVIYTNARIITIHNTFLDPYVGWKGEEAVKYGRYADWADNYFSKGDLPRTQSILPYAYNVEITQLNKQKRLGAFISTGLNFGEPCEEIVSDHGWPHDFYTNTISGSVTSEYFGFGFPLSKEGGGWSYAVANYTYGGYTNLGSPEPQCISFVHGNTQSASIPVIPTSTASYRAGNVSLTPYTIQMFTQSPSWVSMAMNPTSTVNVVSFDAQFTSTNSEAKGLLSVYWDADVLGSIVEQAVLPGPRRYTYAFQNASASTTHMLGFRIDPFTNIQSSVIITNIVLGLAGPSEPFKLSATTNIVMGHRVLELNGQAGFNYAVEASTNLMNWETIAWLVNTNGSVNFYDQSSTNYKQRFYRAVYSP